MLALLPAYHSARDDAVFPDGRPTDRPLNDRPTNRSAASERPVERIASAMGEVLRRQARASSGVEVVDHSHGAEVA